MRIVLFALLMTASLVVNAGEAFPWYTQGNFKPETV